MEQAPPATSAPYRRDELAVGGAAHARAAQLEEIMRGVDYRRLQDGPRWRNLFIGKAAAVLLQRGIRAGGQHRDR